MTKRHLIFTVFFVSVFLLSSLVSYGFFTYQRIFVGDAKKVVAASPVPSPSGPPPPPIYTIALLGHGSPGHEGGLLTDSIMIIKVDTGLEKIGLISVPRDSWVSFPSHGWEEERYWKVNAAYAVGSSQQQYLDRPDEFQGEAGGGELAKYTLEKIVGFPIDYFVALDFTGFQKSIDVLGGVEVDVARTFDDPFYPIPGEEENTCGRSEEDIAALTATLSAAKVEQEFPCRFENLHFDRGTNFMDGETALKFVRSRHSPTDGGDFNRARRQRAVLLAVKDKVLAIDFIPKIIPFVSKLTYNMKTDVSVFQMNEFLNMSGEFLDYEIVGIPLTSDRDNLLKFGVSARGQSILQPKAGIDEWGDVHAYIDLKMQGDEEAALRVATMSGVVVDTIETDTETVAE